MYESFVIFISFFTTGDTSAAEEKKFDRNNDNENDTWIPDKSVKGNKNNIDSLAEESIQLSKSPLRYI